MKISCDIIRDILPLYAEDMVSKATKDMVEEHLCDCEGCTKELEGLRKPTKLPTEVATDALKRVGDSIRRRRILAVATVFLFIATMIVGGALMLDATIYLSAEDAVKDIYITGDEVKIVWDDRIIGSGASTRTEDTGNYAVTAWTNLSRVFFPVEKIPYDQLDEDVKILISEDQYDEMDNTSAYSVDGANANANFWYYDPSEDTMSLLLDAGEPYPEGNLMKVSFHVEAYIILLAVLSLGFILLGRMLRSRRYGEVFMRIAIMLASLSASAVIVTAGQFHELWGAFNEMVVDSTAVALPMTLTGLCLRQLHILNRRDKGM